MNHLVTLYAIGVTTGTYALSRVLSTRWRSPFTTPVFFSTTATIIVLELSRVSFHEYGDAERILTFLLGPATVALAVPLYRNRRLLLDNVVPSLGGMFAGALSTLLTAVALAKLFRLSRIIVASVSVKSVTAAIAVELSRILEGDQTLTAAFVICTGMIGAMLGPSVLTLARIHSPLARGIALGTISHGQGTAQAAFEAELSGAIASISMGIAAVFVSLIAPRIMQYL